MIDANQICYAVKFYYMEIGEIPPLDASLKDKLSGNNSKNIAFLKWHQKGSEGEFLDPDGRPYVVKVIDKKIMVFDSDQKLLASHPLIDSPSPQ